MRFLGVLLSNTPERRRDVYQAIEGMSRPSGSFYVMVAISTTIAAYGLLSNSTAVVIGAMLVAPLMGPIFGIALSLSTGDRRLFPAAATSELLGVAAAVALATLIGLIPLRLGFGSEIVARTQPTLYDIIIALASGLAGAYALMDEKISPALPGVAVATALVPPLTTCGLCLATGRWEWAFGAFMLFVANFLAIQIAAAFIFTAYGMVEVQTHQRFTLGPFVRRFALSLALLFLVSVFMTSTLVGMVSESRLSRAIQRALAQDLRSSVGAQLTDLSIRSRRGAHSVVATVLTPQEFEPSQVDRIERHLRKSVSPEISLVIRSLVSRDADRTGTVYLADEEQERRADVARQTDFLRRTDETLQVQLREVPGARLVDLRQDGANGRTTVTAIVRAPTSIGPEQVAAMEAELRRVLGSDVHLVVRSVLTVTADSQQFLYEQKREARPLVGGALRYHGWVGRALTSQIAGRVPGAYLTDYRYEATQGKLHIVALVRAPRCLGPQDVEAMQRQLRRYLHPGAELVVRSAVGAEANAGGYVVPTGG